ncbi:MAG: NUDIX domain-containing protein [Candidatus Riflebacteria bacterium]|nr:NUDIX domain-containing protein [Candidatus Riflebacteria bacterium]
MRLPPIEVAAAVIARDGKILLAKRRGGDLDGLWEFPGGKIEQDETWAHAVEREILEELALPVIAGTRLLILEHEYPDKRVRLHFVRCVLKHELPADETKHSVHETELHFVQSMPKHESHTEESGWFEPGHFPLSNFCPADRIAINHIDWKSVLEHSKDINSR